MKSALQVVLCIESSFERGMGHFFRSLNIIDYLSVHNIPYTLVLNEDERSLRILAERGIPHIAVQDFASSEKWIEFAAAKHGNCVCIMDRFSTSLPLAKAVKEGGMVLCGIDDCGEGAQLFDLHFCSLLFSQARGKRVFCGKEYLVLNPEIKQYRRVRKELKKILVTLGGSDTYGVTPAVLRLLQSRGYCADVVIGPHCRSAEEVYNICGENSTVYHSVPSMVKLFSDYDFAVTGGGVTCCETNASGLPSIIIANELHEIDIAKYVTQFSGSIFAGYYKAIDESVFDLMKLPLEDMSRRGMQAFALDGVENMFAVICKYWNAEEMRRG